MDEWTDDEVDGARGCWQREDDEKGDLGSFYCHDCYLALSHLSVETFISDLTQPRR